MTTDARILDLVAELIRKGHGEMHVLERIKRAALQNEVISMNERVYIESLVEKFLRPSETKQTPKPVAEPILAPQTKPVPHAEYAPARIKKLRISIKKILMIAIVSAIAAAAYAGANTFDFLSADTAPVFEFSINTDAVNYRIGDIVSVYGSAKNDVKISVLDTANNIVWFDEISPDSSYSYSILIIAAGDGWNAGEYTVMASYGTESDIVKITMQ